MHGSVTDVDATGCQHIIRLRSGCDIVVTVPYQNWTYTEILRAGRVLWSWLTPIGQA